MEKTLQRNTEDLCSLKDESKKNSDDQQGSNLSKIQSTLKKTILKNKTTVVGRPTSITEANNSGDGRSVTINETQRSSKGEKKKSIFQIYQERWKQNNGNIFRKLILWKVGDEGRIEDQLKLMITYLSIMFVLILFIAGAITSYSFNSKNKSTIENSILQQANHILGNSILQYSGQTEDLFNGYEYILTYTTDLFLSQLQVSNKLIDYSTIHQFPLTGPGKMHYRTDPPTQSQCPIYTGSALQYSQISLECSDWYEYDTNQPPRNIEGIYQGVFTSEQITQAFDVVNYILEDQFLDYFATSIQNIYFGIEQYMTIIMYPGLYISGLNQYNLYARPWYNHTLNTHLSATDNNVYRVVTQPYKDAIMGAIVITLSRPILIPNSQDATKRYESGKGQLMGIASVDIVLSNFSQMFENLKFYSTGNCFIYLFLSFYQIQLLMSFLKRSFFNITLYTLIYQFFLRFFLLLYLQNYQERNKIFRLYLKIKQIEGVERQYVPIHFSYYMSITDFTCIFEYLGYFMMVDFNGNPINQPNEFMQQITNNGEITIASDATININMLLSESDWKQIQYSSQNSTNSEGYLIMKTTTIYNLQIMIASYVESKHYYPNQAMVNLIIVPVSEIYDEITRQNDDNFKNLILSSFLSFLIFVILIVVSSYFIKKMMGNMILAINELNKSALALIDDQNPNSDEELRDREGSSQTKVNVMRNIDKIRRKTEIISIKQLVKGFQDQLQGVSQIGEGVQNSLKNTQNGLKYDVGDYSNTQIQSYIDPLISYMNEKIKDNGAECGDDDSESINIVKTELKKTLSNNKALNLPQEDPDQFLVYSPIIQSIVSEVNDDSSESYCQNENRNRRKDQ